MLTIKAIDLWPSIGIKYDASGLTLFMYSSSFVRKFGSCSTLFPTSVGILVLIKNLIGVVYELVLFKNRPHLLEPLIECGNIKNQCPVTFLKVLGEPLILRNIKIATKRLNLDKN